MGFCDVPVRWSSSFCFSRPVSKEFPSFTVRIVSERFLHSVALESSRDPTACSQQRVSGEGRHRVRARRSGDSVSMVLCSLSLPQAPLWAYVACACGLFIYQSLDAIDGKQARRTNSSSPLGELFDHGCDSLSTGSVGSFVSVSNYKWQKECDKQEVYGVVVVIRISDFVQVLVFSKTVNLVNVWSLAVLGNFNFI